MDKAILIVLLSSLLSCSSKSMLKSGGNSIKCDLQMAKDVSLQYLENHKLLTFDPEIKVKDSSNVFLIEIFPASKFIIGGGGKFAVLKDKCEIVDIVLYQ